MAYEKTSRRTFNPANITVNRGDSMSQYGATATQAAFKKIGDQQNLLDKKLGEYKADEKLEGTKLAESTDMVMEDRIFTKKDGTTSTYSIPVKYNKPEDLIQTSWASNTYDEQIEKSYTDAIITSGNEMILAEKSLQNTSTDYSLSIAEVDALFTANLSGPLDALQETVPERYSQYVATKINTLVSAAKSEIATKHHTNLVGMAQKTGDITRTEHESTFITTLFTNTKEKNLLELETTKVQQEEASLGGDKKAKTWITETYPAEKEMIELASNLKPFFEVDYGSVTSITETIYNLGVLEQAYNTGEVGDQLLLTSKEKLPMSVQEAGFNATDTKYRKKIQSTISRAKELLKERLQSRIDSSSSLDHVNATDRYRLGTVRFQSKPEKVIFGNELQTQNSDLLQNLVPKYLAIEKANFERKDMGTYSSTFNASNINEKLEDGSYRYKNERRKFYSYVAGKYKNLPTFMANDIKDRLSSVVANFADGSITDHKQNIEDLVNSGAVDIARGVMLDDKMGKPMFITMLHNIPGIEDDEIKIFKRIMTTFDGSVSADRATTHIISILKREQELKNIGSGSAMKQFLSKTKFASVDDLNIKIDESIKDLISGKFASTDIKISSRYSQAIRQRVVEELMLSVESTQTNKISGIVDDVVETVANRLEKNNRYGATTFTEGRGETKDDTENNEGPKNYGQWPLDMFFIKTEPDFTGFTKTEEGEYTDEYIEYGMKTREIEKNGGRRGRTQAWKKINNMLIEAVMDPEIKPENRQFDFATKLVIGENVFLEPTNDNQYSASKVVYQAVFYATPGGPPTFLKNLKGNVINFDRTFIENIAKDNATPETKVEELQSEMPLSSRIGIMLDLGVQAISPAYAVAAEEKRKERKEEKDKFEKFLKEQDKFERKKEEDF